MQSVLGIIDTTYDFVIQFTVRLLSAYINAGVHTATTESSAETLEIEIQEPLIEVQEEVADVSEEEKTPQSFKTVGEVLQNGAVLPRIRMVEAAPKNTVMYAGTVSVPIFKNPTIEFDTQIGTVPFGDLVMMHEAQGRFYKVTWGHVEGWVLRDDLVDRTLQVHPQFVVGTQNLVDHPNTAHVRAILGDVFGLNRSDFPLQAGEYVLYRLWKKGIHISWPETRPRVPGLWHNILKGVPGIHVGVVPKAGALMEYMINSEIGHLAYVEAVFPDETISISEAHFPDSGIYNERELTREAWRELHPLFITVHQL